MATSSLPEFRPWRELLAIHPAAELFPLMVPDQLAELAKDIAANGVCVPIECLEIDGRSLQLLDGRNRLDAAAAAGFRFAPSLAGSWHGPFRVFDPKGREVLTFPFEAREDIVDPAGLVVSLNIVRRHLTQDQKRELIEKLLIENPDRSNRAIAVLTGTSPTTVITRRHEAEAAGAIPKVDATTGRDGRTRTATPARPRFRFREALKEVVATAAAENKTPQEVIDRLSADDEADKQAKAERKARAENTLLEIFRATPQTVPLQIEHKPEPLTVERKARAETILREGLRTAMEPLDVFFDYLDAMPEAEARAVGRQMLDCFTIEEAGAMIAEWLASLSDETRRRALAAIEGGTE